MEYPEEKQWILQAHTGDREAYAALVKCYWARVLRWAWHLTRDSHAAEDLAQEVFLKAWAGLRSFAAGTSFRAWLFRIAYNRHLDEQRGPRGATPRQLPKTLVSSEPNPVAMAAITELQRILQEACDRLPIEVRAPFLLRTQEELSYAEIARIMHMTEETVRWRVFKARQALLQVVGDTKSHEV